MSGGVPEDVPDTAPKLMPNPLPRSVTQHIYDVTDGATVVNQFLITCTVTPDMLAVCKKESNDIMLLDVQKHIPFVGKLKGTASWTQFRDPAAPECNSSLIVFTDKKLGKFFLYVQHVQLVNCIFNGRLAIQADPKSLRPDATTVVHVQLLMPYTCRACGKHAKTRAELPSCKACRDQGLRFYYCDAECQAKDHAVHLHLCAKNA